MKFQVAILAIALIGGISAQRNLFNQGQNFRPNDALNQGNSLSGSNNLQNLANRSK